MPSARKAKDRPPTTAKAAPPARRGASGEAWRGMDEAMRPEQQEA